MLLCALRYYARLAFEGALEVSKIGLGSLNLGIFIIFALAVLEVALTLYFAKNDLRDGDIFLSSHFLLYNIR